MLEKNQKNCFLHVNVKQQMIILCVDVKYISHKYEMRNVIGYPLHMEHPKYKMRNEYKKEKCKINL